MRKRLIYFLFILSVLFTSCIKDEFNQDNQIKNNVESVFGVKFDSTHDWCSTSNGTIKVFVNSNSEKIVKAQVLMTCVNEKDSTYDIKILNEAKVTNNGNVTLNFDTPNEYSNLYVAFINDKGGYFYQGFKLGDTEVYYDNDAKTRAITYVSKYPIPTITPIINGTVETFANQRGWLPGEVFYKFDYETTSNVAYTEEFISLFNTVIFNYFPNGRNYDNIPQIKRSGYYNEKVYPITTGDDPIVISPVYKNDGGYYEISNAELYYYYFKGNPTVAEIEALPKYRAIDLSQVYTNNENEVVEKKPSYVLAYFGDGTPEIGTEGTYQFPQGYKIGFCYKSNTETDQKRKQGEVYGDGRLNYNINSYGNFASSKLGDTDPRMAWMTVNKQMFLCVESGTDKDFNDLILEVEGGIEPIEIIPDEPEYNYYTFCFEDHNLGDYDMNDVVIRGKRIDETTVEWTLMACGAHDNIYIYNVEGDHINKNNEVHDIFNEPRKTFINTEKDGKRVEYIVDIVTVDKNFSFLDESYQPYIYDATIKNIVKLAIVGQDPHAIMIPYDFKWPIEKVCIKDAYNVENHKFNEWGQKKVTSTDWYKFPILDLVIE